MILSICCFYWTACEQCLHAELINSPVEAVRKLREDDGCDRSNYLVTGTLVSKGSHVLNMQGTAYIWWCAHQLGLPAGETHSPRKGRKVELSACESRSVLGYYTDRESRLVIIRGDRRSPEHQSAAMSVGLMPVNQGQEC